jgi:hypothetical protein
LKSSAEIMATSELLAFAVGGPVSVTLEPDVFRARRLFVEIAFSAGIDKAEKIFCGVVDDARKLQPRKVGRPKGEEPRTHRKAEAILMLEALWKHDDPNMTDQEFIHRFLTFSHEKLERDPARRKRQFNKIRNRLRNARKLKPQYFKRIGRQDT